MRQIQEHDIVRILIPVSGISEVEEKEVSFPAGTEATVIGANGTPYYLLEIGWLTSPVSDDGLIFALKTDEVELVKKIEDMLPGNGANE